MMFVVFLPFATAVLARYSWNGSQGAGAATELYSCNMLAIGLAFQGLWIYLGRHGDLWRDAPPVSLRGASLSAMVIPGAYAVTCVIAPFNTIACYAIWILITLYISIGPSARRMDSVHN
jgi:uncharacterized membrane protein